jgi:hypothetical protein
VVAGLDKFREFFAGYEERYALIGGTACDLLFAEAGLPYRLTKDLDLVICVEVVDADFAARFKEFLDTGGYENRLTVEGERKFYRFDKPADPAFPAMIELFARPGVTLELPDDQRYARLKVEDAVASLSALLLDRDYYEALLNNRRTVDGLTILTEDLLIPFKAKAFLDLSQRKAAGERIDRNDVRKHRNDVFRLLQLMPGDRRVELPDAIRADLEQFIAAIADEDIKPKDFNVALTKAEGIELIAEIYRTAPEAESR